ncbi:MAG: hypothetical protein V3W20_07020 [Candidatus Neomarinimicrobiota bacterium]
MNLEELKQWNNDKVTFIKEDVNQLLDYHSKAGQFHNSRSYVESCQLKILNDLHEFSKECKTLDDVKNRIIVLMNSSNPL